MATVASDEALRAPSKNSVLETVKDLTAGAVGGVVQVLIGQPFDLVKVRLQTQGGSITETVRSIWIKEGPRAFYKVSIQFGAYHGVRRILETQNAGVRLNGVKDLSKLQMYTAGGIAGLANSIIVTPMELIRIRLQMQPDGVQRLYTGPQDCLKKTFQASGLRGLYRGQGVTLLREFHGFGVWFATYEVLVEQAAAWSQQTRAEMPGWKIALCGGIAGDALWFAVYPLDVIKTKLQSDGLGKQQLYKNARDAFRQTWRQTGISGLFAGLGPTLVRTMFTSAGTFVAVENVKKFLD